MTKRKIVRRITQVVIILALSALGLNVSRSGQLGAPQLSQAAPLPGYYKVTHVSDGDTFSVEMAGKTETVRLIGIDTPETKDPRKPVQCFGKVASDKAKELLTGKAVRLEADPANSDRDKYRRLLRYAYLPDGTMINQYMVQNGFAFAYTIFPNSKLDLFRAWEHEAHQAGRGLWAGCQVKSEGEKHQTQDQP